MPESPSPFWEMVSLNEQISKADIEKLRTIVHAICERSEDELEDLWHYFVVEEARAKRTLPSNNTSCAQMRRLETEIGRANVKQLQSAVQFVCGGCRQSLAIVQEELRKLEAQDEERKEAGSSLKRDRSDDVEAGRGAKRVKVK